MATCGTWSGWRQRPKRGPQRQFILHHQRQVTQVSQATLQAGSNYGLSLTRRSAMGRKQTLQGAAGGILCLLFVRCIAMPLLPRLYRLDNSTQTRKSKVNQPSWSALNNFMQQAPMLGRSNCRPTTR